MKIIREGSLPEAKVYQAECNYCHTVVEFQAGEARRSVDQRDGSVDLVVPCPLCKREIWKCA